MSKKEIISIFVEDGPNVMARIVSLFARRGYTIESITSGRTNVKNESRITIVCDVEEAVLNQVITQTNKLEIVKGVSVLEKEHSLFRELILIKVNVDKKERSNLKEIVDIFRGNIISLSKDSMIIEITGSHSKIDGFLKIIECYEVAEVARTGITGMCRNDIDIYE